jgi:hypothetical protein
MIDAHARFWEKVDADPADGCWLWTGRRNVGGYGVTSYNFAGRNHWLAHRLSYSLAAGPIPAGMVLDHLCRVRHCVNPDHLDPCTAVENSRRTARFGGRPKKRPEDRYVTPARSFRPPPELWERVKIKAAVNKETVTDVLIRALEDYVKGQKR